MVTATLDVTVEVVGLVLGPVLEVLGVVGVVVVDLDVGAVAAVVVVVGVVGVVVVVVGAVLQKSPGLGHTMLPSYP